MPLDLALSSTLISSNYPCLELIFMVPKLFEPLKFDFIFILFPVANKCVHSVKVFVIQCYIESQIPYDVHTLTDSM